MSIISDWKSIRSGVKKAKRDYVKIKAFMAEHEARHKADPAYQCGQFRRDFWDNLGTDIDPHKDTFEAAGYRRTVERIQRRIGESEGESGVEIDFLTIEMNGGETPEEVFEKIKRAFRDKATLDEMVSETEDGKDGK